jgi:hypothetical protein
MRTQVCTHLCRGSLGLRGSCATRSRLVGLLGRWRAGSGGWLGIGGLLAFGSLGRLDVGGGGSDLALLGARVGGLGGLGVGLGVGLGGAVGLLRVGLLRVGGLATCATGGLGGSCVARTRVNTELCSLNASGTDLSSPRSSSAQLPLPSSQRLRTSRVRRRSTNTNFTRLEFLDNTGTSDARVLGRDTTTLQLVLATTRIGLLGEHVLAILLGLQIVDRLDQHTLVLVRVTLHFQIEFVVPTASARVWL